MLSAAEVCKLSAAAVSACKLLRCVLPAVSAYQPCATSYLQTISCLLSQTPIRESWRAHTHAHTHTGARRHVAAAHVHMLTC
jgi:hypothetical protein